MREKYIKRKIFNMKEDIKKERYLIEKTLIGENIKRGRNWIGKILRKKIIKKKQG